MVTVSSGNDSTKAISPAGDEKQIIILTGNTEACLTL